MTRQVVVPSVHEELINSGLLIPPVLSSGSPRPRTANRRHEEHKWTPFEQTIVLALICKGEHQRCNLLTFTTKINEALNGNADGYEHDIPVRAVERLLLRIEEEKKGGSNFIERQGRPHVLTRTKRRAFQRNLGFDGSLAEWKSGRGDKVMADKCPKQGIVISEDTSAAVPRNSIASHNSIGDHHIYETRSQEMGELRKDAVATDHFLPFHNVTNRPLRTTSQAGSSADPNITQAIHASRVDRTTPSSAGPGSATISALHPLRAPLYSDLASAPWRLDAVQARIDNITANSQGTQGRELQRNQPWGGDGGQGD